MKENQVYKTINYNTINYEYDSGTLQVNFTTSIAFKMKLIIMVDFDFWSCLILRSIIINVAA